MPVQQPLAPQTVIASRAVAQTLVVSAPVQAVRTAGYATAGDGGAAIYARVFSAPVSGGFRSGDRYLPDGTTDPTNGGWWALAQPVVTAQQFGIFGDCIQSDQTINTTSGSSAATLNGVEPGLKVGHTICVNGAAMVVATVSGTAVTFTTSATATNASARFIFGTDNTSALNTFFGYIAASGANGDWPAGRYLITNTIGMLEPGPASGYRGLHVRCGGISNNLRRAFAALSSGTVVVWGGAASGTMMQFARVLGVHFSGGLSLSGQPSYDPAGVFTLFGARAGIGIHVSQNGTPWTGTGYFMFDDLWFEDLDQPLQFGTNSSDNNCDTTYVGRMVLNRTTNGVLIKHTQGLAYKFNWIHAISVPGAVVKATNGAGGFEIGSLHLSGCGTASGTASADTYSLDLDCGVNGSIVNVGLMRIESASVRSIAVRNANTSLYIGQFLEASNTSTDKTLFYLKGGRLRVGGGRLLSQKNTGETPFLLDIDVNSISPKVDLDGMEIPINSSLGFPVWNTLFTFGANATPDVNLTRQRSPTGVVFEDRHTRLERGDVIVGGPTTDATTSIQLDPMLRLGGASYTFGYGPRVPRGVCIVQATIIANRGDGLDPSIFIRRLRIKRSNAGTSTIVGVETLGTDLVQGTDQIDTAFGTSGFAVTPSSQTLTVNVKGTAATHINWECRWRTECMMTVLPDF